MKLRFKPAGTLLRAMAEDPARKRLSVDTFYGDGEVGAEEPLAKIPPKGEAPPPSEEPAAHAAERQAGEGR